MGDHLIGDEFQSDKYPTCPAGKVPLSTKDPTAQDLLWEYAQRRRVKDAEFADDLEVALRLKGYDPRRDRLRRLLQEVIAERAAQDREWGGSLHDDEHGPLDWIRFVLGHVAKAAVLTVEVLDEGHRFTAKLIGPVSAMSSFRRQMIRVAALAVAAVESFDRKQADERGDPGDGNTVVIDHRGADPDPDAFPIGFVR